MRAGPLKKVVSVGKYTTTLDSYGQEVVTYTTLQDIRASINPATGNEVYMNDRLINEVSHKIEIRYNATLNLNPKDVLVYNSRTFNIISVINWNEGNDRLIVLCKEKL